MRKSRFTEEQIIGVLKDHQAGLPVTELCRKHGISDATFYNWRSRYGGMEISDAKKLKALEEENRKLKKLLAESVLDVATLKEAGKKLLTPGSRRKAVIWAIEEKSYSQRRACSLLSIAPKCSYLSLPWRRRCGSHAAPRVGGRAAPVRISAFAYSAAARRDHAKSQEAVPALPRGTTGCAAAWRSQAGFGNARANDAATGSEPALEAGLRLRRTGRRPPLSGAYGGGRLHPRMPGAGGGYIAVRSRVVRELNYIVERRGAPCWWSATTGPS